MNSTHRTRRDSSAKHRSLHRKPRSQKKLDTTEADESAARLFTFTIDANTAQIVKLESRAPNGARHELSGQEKASLVSDAIDNRLESLVEQAFEAGIACVLDDANEDLMQESAEDAEITRLLLRPLIERTAARRLLHRDVLGRAMLGSLIRQSIESGPVPQRGEPPAGLQ